MSTAAAEAAAGSRALGPRPRLRAVPDQAGPAPRRGPSHPLVLGCDARARLRCAVRELLNVPGLEGLPDSARLAVIVLAAKTSAESGLVEIRAGELARWLGLSVSRLRRIVRMLHEAGVVDRDTATGDWKEHTGLECKVLPLWAAYGKPGHPLALVQREFAVFLRLVEAVFGPGWRHRDRPDTPAGLLAWRKGRGGCTDRLALLVLVLEATETGRVRLCGGKVNARGRAAATLARLLGCGLAGAEAVLERLEAAGLVARPRRETVSDLRHRGRLVVPAVAAAHGKNAASVVREQRVRAAKPDFSDPDATPGGSDSPEADEEPQVEEEPAAEEAGTPDPDVVPTLHTDHASGAGTCGDGAGGWCCSGNAGSGCCDRPERARAREDQAVDGETASAGSASAVAEECPLRGEKPKKSSVDERDGQRAPRAEAGGRPKAVGGGKTQRQRRVGLPADLGLRVALGPVAWLWERLNGWQQDRVEEAVKRELGRLKDLLMQPDAAPRLLADRLTDRLEEIGGEALVRSPYGWLIRRGLVQRPDCSDLRCDDGIRLDTGGECENCGNVIHLRRTRRARIAAEIDRALPGLGADVRRRILEDRLREQVAIEAEDFVWRREQAAAEQARWHAVRGAAGGHAESERQAAVGALRQAKAARQHGVGGLSVDPGSGRRPADRSGGVGVEPRVAPEVSVPEAPVVCGVCRTEGPVDSLSGVCGSCAGEMQGLLAPEMERLDGDGQRLLMRLVSGGGNQASSRSWKCKVPSCGRRQVGVPPASGRCAPCDREAAGKPPPWEGIRGDRARPRGAAGSADPADRE
ncbi:hypothetical protein [Streptomyces malaysiensis]|uniref:Uncharacterized protein n=1 Tax=Streptomyces malaysiensis subsp. samsunensis TaxID=459658 RepID=A0A9X2M205_STRMQ|nr:hypothetical protein [Streptomyces samsunensis]MCQ8833739.1 hypothetical protein [Streptomyces samsunensis]